MKRSDALSLAWRTAALVGLIVSLILPVNADEYAVRAAIYSDGRVTRFDHSPIRVRLGALPEGMESDGYIEAFEKAVRLWEAATNGLVRVEYISRNTPDDQVDIPVHWVTNLSNDALVNHLAHTILSRESSDAQSAAVRMNVSVYD
ncbi:MAG: hypothetical protein O3A46_12095, partial [Candidatus Poribacteria bacterium]|nr:hypothetical protein [Candidatus Poribacteria bacterium]